MSKNTAPSFFRSTANGKIAFDFGSSNDYARSVFVQADGKILVAGQTNFGSPPAWKFGIVRYHANGGIDTSFGDMGKVATYFNGFDAPGTATALQADGKILMIGQAFDGGDGKAIMCRYNADGQLDTSFGIGGSVMTTIDSSQLVGDSIAVQADGKIIIAGGRSFGKSATFSSDFFVARYLSDGTLDMSFDSDGIQNIDFNGGYDRADTVLIQSDGKVLVGGYSAENNGVGLARFNQDGSLDLSFGINGKLVKSVYSSGSSMRGMAIDAEGNILTASNGIDFISNGKGNGGFLIARLKSNGSIDTSFGKNGFVNTDMGTEQDVPNDIIVQSDGKILVVGWTADGVNNFYAAARYLKNGELDHAFGNQGKITVKIGANTSSISQLAGDVAFKTVVQDDGRILVVGQSYNGTDYDFGIVRLLSNGAIDTKFGGAGDINTLDAITPHVFSYPAVAIDNNVEIYDPELALLNNGLGNYDGSSIRVQRLDGINPNDEFTALGKLKFLNNIAYLDGIDIGSVQTLVGALTLTFNSNATQERVNLSLSSLGYRNSGDKIDQQINIQWIFDDGNRGVQGDGNSLKAVGVSKIVATATDQVYPYWIDALLEPGKAQFIQDQLGDSKVYQFAFPTVVPSYGSAYDGKGFLVATAEQIVLVKNAFNYLSSIVDLAFKETNDPAQANTIAIANYELPRGLGASAAYPEVSYIGSDINLDSLSPASLFPIENSWFTKTFMHELGHALGLQHPFEKLESGRTLSQSEDNSNNTVMSYGDTLESHAIKYGPLDIAALQYVYGVSPTARPGDDVYKLSTLSSNFIWDGAGIDTISAEGIQQSVTLHLTPGNWDYIGARGVGIMSPGQVTVNFGSRIENLIGGSNSDFLFGSDFDNRIDGGAGNDTIFGGKGNDVINGGDGFDQANYSRTFLTYTITKSANGLSIKDKLNSDDSDVLSGIESLRFDDISINLAVKEKAASISAAEVKTLIEIYVAFFNRTPDADGLSYWIDQVKAGTSISSISESFYNIGASSQFAVLTGFTTDMTNTDFINTFYKNVLGRSDGADPGGLEYWMTKLITGASTRGSLAQDILNSAHTFKGNAEYGYVADLLDNKYLVGKTIAIDWGITHINNPYGHGIEIAKAVTPTNIAAALKLVGISDLDMQFM